MFICEYGFEFPDHEDPNYSLTEIDIYGWIPASFRRDEEDHSLSVRKNLNTKEFELYKSIHRTNEKQVLFSSLNLQETLIKANDQWNYYHSKWSKTIRECDLVCEHKSPNIDMGCNIYQRKLKECENNG